jgi:integrase
MSVYLVKGKGWRYDFTLRGERYTETWFKTKKEAVQAEAKRREELRNPVPVSEETWADISFIDLVNLRLDFIQAYKTRSYYDDNRYLFKRLVRKWGDLKACQVTSMEIQKYMLERSKVSHYAANYDLRLLKALFNHGIQNKVISDNPARGVPFLPIEKRTKYVPSVQDIDKVLSLAAPDVQDYLWTIRETMGRMSEIHRLTWDDIDLEARWVTLYTRKKKGGHLTPRKIPMTAKLFEILNRRFEERDGTKPWVFWQRYWCRKTSQWKEGPYQDRKKIMKTLCQRAGVKYFRFHPLRHAGASLMDNNNVPIVAIQEILGHENRTTTEIYLHSVSGAARQAMSVYEQVRQNSHTDSHTNEKGSQDKTRNPLILLVGR